MDYLGTFHDDIQSLNLVFNSYDNDFDGTLTREELLSGLENQLREGHID
jgi:Ca2+-binding EF-hand superfamily protein